MPRRFRPKDFAFGTRRGLSHRNNGIRDNIPGGRRGYMTSTKPASEPGFGSALRGAL